MTGKNSVGKSTLIDALQVVLLGETSGKNFNKAANDKAARTIAGYLYADSGSTDEMDVKHSRKGQMFETYIVCEFFDDVEIKSFSMGVVFDCEKSGEFSYKYFWHENGIPEKWRKNLREYAIVSQVADDLCTKFEENSVIFQCKQINKNVKKC